MKVILLTTVFHRDDTKEKENSKRLRYELTDPLFAEKIKSTGFDVESIEPYYLGRGMREVSGGVSKDFCDMVKKGRAIREKLSGLIDESDLSNTIILFMDGDGQIPVEVVPKMLEILKTNEVVMACRGDNKGIHKTRADIEQFEFFILSEKYKIKLYDGQCGCWGFQGALLDKFALTANAFDIELNILINSLENGISPSFLKINLGEEIPSDSTYTIGDSDEEKMIYIARRLMWDKDFIIGKLKEYEERENTIDERYKELVLKMDWPLINESQKNLIKPLNSTLPYKHRPICYECDKECHIMESIEK